MRKSQKQLEETYRRIALNIQYLQIERGTPPSRCALACGISVPTWRRRLKNPQEFTVGELESLASLWNTSVTKIQHGQLTESGKE